MCPALEMEVIVAAQIPMPYDYVFRAEGRGRLGQLRAGLSRQGNAVRSPFLAFIVHHPAAGAVLIDTGLHPGAFASLREEFGSAMGWLFRELELAAEPYDVQLRGIGIEPGDVRRVVMTHLHADHTSGMRLLPNAEFVCSRREWEATQSRLSAARGYVRHHLPPRAQMRLVDFDSDGEPHGPFGKTIDLLGDGSLRLISTPGHTAGHISVLLRGVDGRDVLLVGDAAYTLRSIRDQALPMLTFDDAASRRSLAEIKRFSEEHREAILIPTHDPEAYLALLDDEVDAIADAGGSNQSLRKFT